MLETVVLASLSAVCSAGVADCRVVVDVGDGSGVAGRRRLDAVGLSRRLNVALDVRRFLVAGVRLDRDLLHDRRVDAADQDAQHEQHDRNRSPGSSALRSHRLASTPTAMMTAIQNRIVLAGSDALTSV